MPKLTCLRKFILLFFVAIIIFSLTGCSKKEDEETIRKEKVEQEIAFLDNKIITMMNLLNNISFTNYKVTSENVKQEQSSSESSSSSKQSSNEENSSSESKQGENNSSSSSEKEESGNQNENNKIFKLTQDVILLNDEEQNMDIQWEEIKKDVENLYTIWSTISIDLNSIGANSSDIIEFNTFLDEVAKAVKEENKQNSLTSMAKLYGLIPKYMSSYSSNDLNKKVINTKSYILNAYSMADSEKWNEIDAELTKAIDSFNEITNGSNIDTNKQLNISRSYLLLKELQKSTEVKDKQIFYLRYKNVLQELNII